MTSTVLSAVRTMPSRKSGLPESPRAPVNGFKKISSLGKHFRRAATLSLLDGDEDAVELSLPPPLPPKEGDMSSSFRERRLPPPPRPHRSPDSDITYHLLDADPLTPLYLNRDEWEETSLPYAAPPTPPRSPRAYTLSKSTSQTAPRSPRSPQPLRPSASLPARRQKSLPRLTPEERAARRAEAAAHAEEERREAERLEAARQARLKEEKAAAARADANADAYRRMVLAEELRAAAFQRDMREREEAAAAERARAELAERRARQKERIAEENRWVEASRLEELARLAELERRRDEEREVLEAERLSRVKQAKRAGDYVGWISVQQEGRQVWRRRWAQLRGCRLVMYNKPPAELDLGKPTDIIRIDQACRIREGRDAPDELEFVAHSLAIDDVGEHGTLLIFTDSAADKEQLLACLRARTDL